MALFGFFAVLFWVCPLMDCSHIFLFLPKITLPAVLATFGAAFFMNLTQAITTAILLYLLGKPLLEKLDRVIVKYGMLGNEEHL